MPIPWLSLLMFALSFIFKKSQGASTGAALLTGAAVGAGTYVLADPANPDNLLKLTYPWGPSDTGELPAGDPPETTDTNTTEGALSTIGSTIVTETGSTLRDWGPTGTATVIGAAAIASDLKEYLPWVIGGLALVAIS